MQLGSIIILCGKNLIFWDGDFLQSLNGLLDLSNGLTMEMCLALIADSQLLGGQREPATFLPTSLFSSS